MEFAPKLPPGAWVSLKAEEHWESLIERRGSIIQVYQQVSVPSGLRPWRVVAVHRIG